MANNLPTQAVIADKVLEFLENEMELGSRCNRDYKTEFTMSKKNIGRTIDVEKPPRYVAQDGPVINTVQDVNKSTVPFTVNKWKTVPIKLTGLDRSFSAKDFDVYAEKEIRPLVSPLANAVDVDLFNLYKKVANFVGTPATGPTTWDVVGAAKEKLSFFQTPKERDFYLNPTGSRKLGNGLSNNFNPAASIGNMVKEGDIPRMAGFNFFEANNVAAHTVGSITTNGANILTNGADQDGATLSIDACNNTTFNEGDVITIEGVYSVNPTSKASTGLLQDFVVTASTLASGNAVAALPISPAIISSGPFQNVSNKAADGKVITLKCGTASTAYAQQLALWPKAIGLVTVPIAPLEGFKSTTRTYNGLSVTITSGGDIMTFDSIYRLDIAYGCEVFYQENICRVTN